MSTGLRNCVLLGPCCSHSCDMLMLMMVMMMTMMMFTIITTTTTLRVFA